MIARINCFVSLIFVLGCSSPYLSIPEYQKENGGSKCPSSLENVFEIKKIYVATNSSIPPDEVDYKTIVKIMVNKLEGKFKGKKVYYHAYVKDNEGGLAFLQHSDELLFDGAEQSKVINVRSTFGEYENGKGHKYKFFFSINCAHIKHIKPDQVFDEDFNYEILRSSKIFTRTKKAPCENPDHLTKKEEE